jgi:hypothetical protein
MDEQQVVAAPPDVVPRAHASYVDELDGAAIKRLGLG